VGQHDGASLNAFVVYYSFYVKSRCDLASLLTGCYWFIQGQRRQKCAEYDSLYCSPGPGLNCGTDDRFSLVYPTFNSGAIDRTIYRGLPGPQDRSQTFPERGHCNKVALRQVSACHKLLRINRRGTLQDLAHS
jgi:hypothetical protein